MPPVVTLSKAKLRLLVVASCLPDQHSTFEWMSRSSSSSDGWRPNVLWGGWIWDGLMMGERLRCSGFLGLEGRDQLMRTADISIDRDRQQEKAKNEPERSEWKMVRAKELQFSSNPTLCSKSAHFLLYSCWSRKKRKVCYCKGKMFYSLTTSHKMS